MVFVVKVILNFVKKITAQMDKSSAFFTLQMKMFPVCFTRFQVPVAGAFTLAGHILTDGSGLHQLFQVAVDGGKPDGLPGSVPEMIGYIVNRNMAIPQGSQIINDKLPLPGVVSGTVSHDFALLRLTLARVNLPESAGFVNMKMSLIFNI
jgi:hypothetical protein